MKVLVPAGGPTASVVFGETAEPSPAPNEAVIAVAAISINRGETFLLESPQAGWRPGKDVAGTVIVQAKDGTGPAVGARVVAHPDSSGWAERVAVPTAQIATLPESLSFTTAAALPLAGLTALRLLRASGSVAGARILITGASGGVGHYVTELAVNAGATVTAVVASMERGKALAARGAKVVTDISGGDEAFDIVMESVGGDTFAAALLHLRAGGLMLWFGQASKQSGTMPFFEVLSGPTEVTIKHFSYVGGHVSIGQDLQTLVNLVETGRLHPEVGVVARWEDTAAQIAALRERKIRGNAVLTVLPNLPSAAHTV